MNRLVYEFEGKQVEIPLGSRPVSFGRSDDADHQLPTKAASRIHAQVFPRERGWWVEDLHSSNGTLVNGNKILKPTPLVPGDVITVGDMKLKFEGEAAPPKGPPDHLVARIVFAVDKGKPPAETLIRDRVTIGRKPDNTLQIEDKAVSGNHCEIINRQGAYLLRDLGSSNGTFINKQRVTEHTLRNGDVIVLGQKISVYFVDPAGQAPAPQQAQAPAAAAAPAAQAARPAAGSASDRGSFEPIGPEPARRRVNPLPHVAVGLVLGGLFLLAGWLLGDVLGGMANRPKDDPNSRGPEPPLSDAAMSFEGEIDDLGNPEGWSASFEAAGGKAELLSDLQDPYDGKRSLRVSSAGVNGPGTLVLQTTQARKLELGGGFQFSLCMRGEGAGKVAVSLSALNEKGDVLTLAAGSFVGIKGTAWGQFTMTGTTLVQPPENAQLRLMVSGAFSRLWLDRIELVKTAEPRITKPFSSVDAPGLSLGFDARNAAQAVVSNGNGNEVRFQPLLLAFNDAHLTEPELWAVTSVQPDAVSWSAMQAGQGDAAAVRMTAKDYANGYFNDHGLSLKWDVTQGAANGLAVQVILPLPPGATLAVADRRGYPMALERSAVHAYSYSTISELMVNETGISISFPRGAVVWFDLSRPGEAIATVRSAADGERRSVSIDVNSRPLMFARLYQRLLDETARLMEAEHFSAAEARLKYLTAPGRPDSELPVIKAARERLKEIDAHRTDLGRRLESAWQEAQTARSKATVAAAKGLVLQYIAEFPGDDVIRDMNDRLKQLETWEAQLAAQARTPEEMKAAEAVAKSLYDAADQSNKQGNLLLALVMLENIQRDYADTSHYKNAVALMDEINRKLADPAEQNRVIDKELAQIDEDIKFADYNTARDRCLKLFKRFPATPRTRDIMRRLRTIEKAFED